MMVLALGKCLPMVSAAVLLLLASSTRRVDGFSVHHHHHHLPPSASSQSLLRSWKFLPTARTSSSAKSRLHMSDIAYNNNNNNNNNNDLSINVISPPSFDTTSSTEAVGEIGTIPSPDTVEPMPTDGSSRLQRLLQDVDINEVINTGMVVLVSLAVLVKLTMVNAGMTRGWTMEEMVAQTVASNWSGYMMVLRESPIATKAVTSATVYAIGDLLAQRTDGTRMGHLDRARIARSMLVGLVGHGPLSHVWYQVSEQFFGSVLHWTQWWSFLPKVVVDQTVFGPIWNNSYILLLGMMKMESLDKIWSDMKRTTIPLLVSGLKLWPLAHCVTYGLIPVENRLLWVDLVEIVWVTVLATQAAALDQPPEEAVVTTREEEVADYNMDERR